MLSKEKGGKMDVGCHRKKNVVGWQTYIFLGVSRINPCTLARTTWSSGSSQGDALASHTWMWPIDDVSLYWPHTPPCPKAFSPDFLTLRTYSRRVSRHGDLCPFHYPPPHLKHPRLRKIQPRVKRKGKEVGRRKKSSMIIWLQWTWGKWWVASYVSYSEGQIIVRDCAGFTNDH